MEILRPVSVSWVFLVCYCDRHNLNGLWNENMNWTFSVCMSSSTYAAVRTFKQGKKNVVSCWSRTQLLFSPEEGSGVSYKLIRFLRQQRNITSKREVTFKQYRIKGKNSGIFCKSYSRKSTSIVQQVEVTRRRGRRRKKLLDDLWDRRGYCHLKGEALDRTKWRNRFGRRFGPVVWQITNDDDDDDDQANLNCRVLQWYWLS